MAWIKSAGGPLICLETWLLPEWCGVEGTCQSGNCVVSGPSDYDRACAVNDYVGLADVGRHSALILGDMPLATTIFNKTVNELYVVRAFYMDPDTEIEQFAHWFDEGHFRAPLETLFFSVCSNRLSIFDSAYPGSDRDKDFLEFSLSPGTYAIKTARVDPNEQTSLVVHQFRLKT